MENAVSSETLTITYQIIWQQIPEGSNCNGYLDSCFTCKKKRFIYTSILILSKIMMERYLQYFTNVTFHVLTHLPLMIIFPSRSMSHNGYSRNAVHNLIPDLVIKFNMGWIIDRAHFIRRPVEHDRFRLNRVYNNLRQNLMIRLNIWKIGKDTVKVI
jgi:hypothetical protein